MYMFRVWVRVPAYTTFILIFNFCNFEVLGKTWLYFFLQFFPCSCSVDEINHKLTCFEF